MDFKSERAIYLQIADHILEKILTSELKAQDRIPSVRELAVDLQVNPNTVVRTFSYLEELGIIYKERGIGYFIAKNAYEKTLKIRKNYFFKHEVPLLFRTMELLHITINDLKQIGESYEK